MHCPACITGRLDVSNSRKYASEWRVWRRRQCRQCGFTYTSQETPQADGSLVLVCGRRDERPFSQALLLRALFAAGGHLKQPEPLLALSETITSQTFKAAAGKGMRLAMADYQALVVATLRRYDPLLAANYQARL